MIFVISLIALMVITIWIEYPFFNAINSFFGYAQGTLYQRGIEEEK